MKKYWQVTRNTWDEMVSYRLNFVVWRLRVVLQFLTIYFLWTSLIPTRSSIFGYTQTVMVTYLLGIAFLSAFVMASRTQEIGDNINSGELSFFLIRPTNYFFYWLFRDIGDKLMNMTFSVIELTILFLILRPHLIFQHNPLYLLLTICAAIAGSVLYFIFGCLLGFIGFWSSEVWAPRFILFILLNFFAGSIFPLDILPKPIFTVFQLSPFPYLIYFPMKIYLGQLSLMQISSGFIISFLWIGILLLFARSIWMKGIKRYAGYGQ